MFEGDMDTASDDILQVAVYGTQAVYPTITDEEITMIVKEEPDDTFEIPLEEKNINVTRHDNMLNTPLVYTTRLDNMRAFNKIKNHTTKEITEMIEKESKPCYIQTPERIKIKPLDADFTSFIRLNHIVHFMNSEVQIETCQKNIELLNLCKPLKIVLTDILTHKKTIVQADDDEAEHIDTSSDDEPLSIVATSLRLKMRANQYSNKAIAIRDKQAQEVDLYIIDKSGVTNYYRTGEKQCSTLQKLHQIKDLVYLEYCCWIDREKLIETLAERCSYNAITYMRTPHNCLPRPCTCCCFKEGLPKKRNDEEINLLLISNSDCQNNNKKKIDKIKNNVIEKAIHYQTVPKLNVIKNAKPFDANLLKNAVIILKYHGLMFTQFHNILGENYVIGKEGKVINYHRPTINRSLLEEKKLYQKSDKPKEPRTYFTHLICCWYCRKEAIAHICKIFSLLPSTLQFIKSIHPCKSFICRCCCKPAPVVNIYKNSKETIQDHFKNISSMNENRELIYFNDFGKIQLSRHRKGEDQEAAKNIQRKRVNNQRNKDKGITNKNNVPQKTLQNTIDSAVVSYLQKSPTINYPQAISNSTSITNIQPSVNPAVTNANLAQPITTKLTQNFIGKIKNYKLAVNENGKLTAMLIAKPDEIPTADIKMISEVLSLASEQIKILGITPQEFCKQVNNLNSLDRLKPTLMPKLNKLTKPLNNELTITTPLPMGGENLSTLTKTSRTTDFILPKTSNLNPVSSIFQMMSSLGGQKNQNLVESYITHFGDKIKDSAVTPSIFKTESISPIISRGVLKKQPSPVMPVPIIKRKKVEIVGTPTIKKTFRLIPFNQLPTLDPFKKLQDPKIENVINQIPEDKKITITSQKTICSAVPCPPVALAANKDFQDPLDSNNSKTIQAHSFNVELVPSIVGNNITLKPAISLVASHHKIVTSNNSKSAEISSDTIVETVINDTLNMDDNCSEVTDHDMEIDAASEDFNNIMTQINVSRTNVTAKPVLVSNPILFDILSKAPSVPCSSKFGLNDDLDYETPLKSDKISTKENDDYAFDEILETVNNKKLISDQEEGEGIFGV